MDIDILKEAGLTTTETKVYLALLELGNTLAGDITKKSELNRTIVYYSLEKLIDKGLVTYVIESNRKVFKPVNPERIVDILKEKEKDVQSILPFLKEKYHSIKTGTDATIYRGKKGLKNVFEDILKNYGEYFAFGAEAKFEDFFPTYFHNWNKRRINKKVKIHIIYSEKVRERRQGKLKLTEMKFLPKEFDFPSTTIIYGNKVSILLWADQPFAFVINSKEVVKSYMNQFKMLWKIAKK